jgi:hypothetical protein
MRRIRRAIAVAAVPPTLSEGRRKSKSQIPITKIQNFKSNFIFVSQRFRSSGDPYIKIDSIHSFDIRYSLFDIRYLSAFGGFDFLAPDT